MANTTLLPALLLTGLCSAALAGTGIPVGVHTGGARTAQRAPVSLAHGDGNVRSAAQTRVPVAASPALPNGATLRQSMVGGVHATVVEMRTRSPLKEPERRKLQQMGFAPVIKGGDTYYCRHERWTGTGWTMDCFKPVT